ncbi:MAG: peroxidase-related enzyme [Saprospiraceae bacterium]|nr:peroxidase-related enzyme [Saprospiraceae bacterium]
MPYIKTIEYENADHELLVAYDAIIGARGKLAEVHKIQSLNPAALLAHMDLYKVIMFGHSPLKRYQREMLAVIVSAANQCKYCVEHHRQALLFYWKDEQRIDKLMANPETAGLNASDVALCMLAVNLTLKPPESSSQTTENLRVLGLDDRAILDAAQIIAYFNFVNRLVLSLGVTFNSNESKGYNY